MFQDLHPNFEHRLDMLVAGAVAIVFGFWGAARANSWQGTVNGIIDIWLFLSAIWFLLVVPWNFFIFGVAIAILAVWNIVQNPETVQTHAHAH